MFTSGSDYKLAKKLKSLADHHIESLRKNDRLELMREKIKSNMHKAFKKVQNATTKEQVENQVENSLTHYSIIQRIIK